MNQKLNCILLIDDDEATNFLNEIVIKHADCAEKCVTVQSGGTVLQKPACSKLIGHYYFFKIICI